MSDADRRTFLKTGLKTGFAVLGRGTAARDTLAVSGGAKTVTFPAARVTAMNNWPRYGAAEKKALHDLIGSQRRRQGVGRQPPPVPSESFAPDSVP